MHAAARSAFTRSTIEAGAGTPGTTVTSRIHPYALAFVAGLPAAIGGLALAAAMTRTGVQDGAFWLGVPLVVVAACLLVLGVRSVITVRPDGVTARFFGIRATTVNFDRLESATFGMTFPSISYGIALTDADGAKLVVHANWWRDEAAITRPILRALVDNDVSMDRATARVVSRTLGIPRPKARILHRALCRPDRTW